uniref:Uncharacterized protein n=1 Tax=Cacopsylla melanoneura TaxID=428564 RepID=A0A8D8VGN4_9HEMI
MRSLYSSQWWTCDSHTSVYPHFFSQDCQLIQGLYCPHQIYSTWRWSGLHNSRVPKVPRLSSSPASRTRLRLIVLVYRLACFPNYSNLCNPDPSLYSQGLSLRYSQESWIQSLVFSLDLLGRAQVPLGNRTGGSD